jgi:spermidine synthase
MAEFSSVQTASLAPRRFLPLLMLLFVGSGCAALIYEIVWFQMLQLVIGSTAVSMGVLLGTFMGGMCLGSLALPRLISARRHPLRVYALLEMGIGVFGILLLFGIPLVDWVYVANIGHGFPSVLLRGVVCAVCLLPPTVLMGATLPAIARWVEETPQGVSWLGFFYGGNIAGAVFGCLLAGFYLLRVHDMATAVYVAAAINGTVALIALGFSNCGLGIADCGLKEGQSEQPGAPSDSSHQSEIRNLQSEVSSPQSAIRNPQSAIAWTVYVAIALSGMSALGAEVVWTRLLSLMLGATVYTFSIILAVFLFGLGIGSSVGALLARATMRPSVALAGCQMLLAAAIAWTAWMLARSLPYWPIDPTLSTSPWFNFQLDLIRCAWAILPATLLWGASFPLALAAAASRGQDAGRLVGAVYAANTVGAIIGAIGFSILLVGWMGTQHSQQLLIGISAAAAIAALTPALLPARAGASSAAAFGTAPAKIAGALSLAATTSIAALLAANLPGVSWELIAYGRFLPSWTGRANFVYSGEGMNASVAVSELDDGVRNFHVSGKIEASTHAQDMRLQRMLGHIPALLHPNPRSVLVVGCGAGVTAGSFVVHPEVERIVICEIEPLIPQVVAKYFGYENHDVLRDKRVTIVYDDARHYVLTTGDKFDVITCDPIHPWVKGAATLYTKEYFELCRARLNPGGLITQWVPLYESTDVVVKSELATFFEVFPNGTIWSNDDQGKGYDTVLLGQAEPMRIDVDAFLARLDAEDHQFVAESLHAVGFESGLDLLATYAGQGADLRPWLEGAEINRDRNLRLQYLAGMGLNSYQGRRIYDDMLAYRTYPETLFVLSEAVQSEWKRALTRKSLDSIQK